MTPITASNQFKFRQIQATNPSDKSKWQIHVNNKIRTKFLFHVKLKLSWKWIIHHYVDWPLVFLNEILTSAIKFLERLLKPQGYIALWQKSINQALVVISEIIIVWVANGKAKTITKVDDIEPELSMSRKEILNVIDKWVSEGSRWVIDRIDSHYINVTTYKPLNGSSYIELSTELRNPKKGLINIKNKDDKCFRWCHIRHLIPQTEHPERNKKEDKRPIEGLNYERIEFPVSQKHYNKVEKQNSIRINVFGYENGQPFPIHVSKETFEDQMDLLLISKDEKKHYVLKKDFNAFMYNQSKHKERKHFCMYCLQCFSSERTLANHVNNCLTIQWCTSY